MKTANRLLVVLHLWPQGLEEGDEPPHSLLWSMVDLPYLLQHAMHAQSDVVLVNLSIRHLLILYLNE